MNTSSTPVERDAQEEQRHIASIILHATGAAQFALAGSGAVREHGIIHRPTQDVDVFTVMQAVPQFNQAVDLAIDALRQHGYEVSEQRRLPEFARLNVMQPETKYSTDVDFGIDWREQPPVQLEVGAVLALDDAVANKMLALYSRGEVRDYLDFDAIRQSGKYEDAQLLALAKLHDPGFDVAYFIEALRGVTRIKPRRVVRYNISEQELHDVQQRCLTLAQQLERAAHHAAPPTTPTVTATTVAVPTVIHHAAGGADSAAACR